MGLHMLDEAVLDEATNAGRGRQCWTRPPMLDEAIQDEAARPPMLDEAIQAEAARSPMLDEVI